MCSHSAPRGLLSVLAMVEEWRELPEQNAGETWLVERLTKSAKVLWPVTPKKVS